jgi:hypothetical protein
MGNTATRTHAQVYGVEILDGSLKIEFADPIPYICHPKTITKETFDSVTESPEIFISHFDKPCTSTGNYVDTMSSFIGLIPGMKFEYKKLYDDTNDWWRIDDVIVGGNNGEFIVMLYNPMREMKELFGISP